MKPHILHVRDFAQSIQGRATWWVIGDADHTLAGRIGETKAALMRRWVTLYGSPADGFIRVTGFHRLSEAAATLGSLKVERDRGAKGGAK